MHFFQTITTIKDRKEKIKVGGEFAKELVLEQGKGSIQVQIQLEPFKGQLSLNR